MKNPWLAWYPGDYVAKTRFLTMAQHGAYSLLLWEYYINGPIPAHAQHVLNLCSAHSEQERDDVQLVLAKFFVEVDGFYRNERSDREIEKREGIRDKRVMAGKARQAKVSTCSISQPAHAQHMLTQSQSQSQSQESKSIKGTDKRKATRIPPNYVVTEEMRIWAKKENCPSPDQHLGEFLDYWTAKAGKDATKMDWDATFHNWLRNAAKFAPRNGKRLDGWTPPLNMPADYVPESVKRSRELAARKAQGA